MSNNHSKSVRFVANSSVSVSQRRFWSPVVTSTEWRVIDMHRGSHAYGPEVVAAYSEREGWADPEGSARRLADMLNGAGHA